MKTGIKGKKALVTGASKGLGRSVALALAHAGASIAIVSRTMHDLEQVKGEIESTGGACHVSVGDMTDPKSVHSTIENVHANFGSPDIIVHNAGGSLRITDPFADAEQWQKVWYFNVGSGIDINNRFIPSMTANGWGRIVHIGSASTSTFGGNAPYVSAKCALVGYVKSISRNVAAQGIVVSAVSPGPINVPGRYLAKIKDENGPAWKQYCDEHLALRRLAEPDELAHAVTFLCSDSASYAVGTILGMDGGTM